MTVQLLPELAVAGPLQAFTLPAIALCYAVAYGVRARTLARRGAPVPRWRIASFATGLLLLVVALGAPVDDLADDLLVAHMAQHLLLADLAALALVLGVTGPLLAPVLRIRLFDRLRVLTHPIAAGTMWTLDLYVWHSPFLYQAALHHDLVHAVEHTCFLFFGILLWMPLFGPLPTPEWFGNLAKLVYIVAVRLIGTVLANVLLWDSVVLYPFYRGSHGISAASDQSAAGALMMIEESLLTIGLFAWLFVLAARRSEERQELLELAAARGVELSERRAARAVTAGRGAELRRRVLAEAPDDPSQPAT
ncbi:MAG: cytochrome c oxidase assembly protein [Solirubrobacteraceae bacterium]